MKNLYQNIRTGKSFFTYFCLSRQLIFSSKIVGQCWDEQEFLHVDDTLFMNFDV